MRKNYNAEIRKGEEGGVQIKFSSIGTQMTRKIWNFVAYQNCISSTMLMTERKGTQITRKLWISLLTRIASFSVRDREERKTRKKLHDWVRDHFCWKMSQPKKVQVTCTASFFHNLFKRIFRCMPNRYFFDEKESIWK